MAKKDRPEGSIENMTDEQEQKLFADNLKKYERLLAAKKAADKALQDHGKIIKSDHGEHGLLMIKTTIALRKPESESAEKEKIEAVAKAMRWSGLPIGSQGSLFEPDDGLTVEQRAFEAGKRAGIRGESMSAPVEYGTGDAYQEWAKGWHAGQESIFAIRKGPDAGKDAQADQKPH